MANQKQTRSPAVPPRWLFAIACLAVIILGYFGWQAIFGREGEPGPPKKITPGMYDLRAEVAKMRAAKEKEAAQHGP